MLPHRSSLLLIALTGLFVGGCSKAKIKSYTIPKEKPAAPFMGQMAGSSDSGTPSMPPGHPQVGDSGTMGQMDMPGDANAGNTVAPDNSLVWSAPSAWVPKALGSMRRGSYSVKSEGQEGDLSIFVFPGAAGGLVDNINRWRGQIGLAPVDAEKVAAETVAMKTTTGIAFTFVDMNNGTGDGILGAILLQGDQSWFFKLKGPTGLLAKEKSAFVDFLKSVKAK